MKDASTDKPVLATDAALAADSSDGNAQDGEASPQARDKRPIVIGRREHTAEPDKSNIEQWREAYKNNPLIRVPVQNFAADVLEPGLSVTLELGDDADGDAVPSVPDDHYAEQYQGLDLDTALEQWLANSYIDGWDFDASATDLLEAIVKDRRGRRGTGLVEHSWDDPTKRERLLALRPIKTETVTAYIREGKAIALRPDDNANDFESVAVDDLGDNSRETAPETPAGKTAAIAQFDDVFGASERDEIPFALDDITVSAYDADTGALFGRPDTATVAERADAVKEKLAHIDQAILNTAFANIIAKVDTDDRELAKKIRDDLSVNSPDTVSGTNVPVEITELEGSVPDAVDTIQQEIEFVLAAMPTPLYRVGFAGDINRDVTDVQQEDYRDEVKRERRRLEADFQGALEQKAREYLHGSAQADDELDVTPRLRIRPEEAASPLRDEEFDPEAFATLMNGLATAAGPKGGADTIVPQDEIVDTFLDMDPEDVLGGDGADEADLDESDPRVQQAFAEFTGASAQLAARYEPGEDLVQTPDGLGLVVETITETREIDEGEAIPDRVEASSESPTYVVTLADADPPLGFYKANDLSAADVNADVTPLDELGGEAAEMACAEAELGDWSPPGSWQEADLPARAIGLKAFASMGGDFEGCESEMDGNVATPDQFCGAFLDWIFSGYDYWRGDSFLPGD